MAKIKKNKKTTEQALKDIQSLFRNHLVANKYVTQEDDETDIDYISTGYPMIDLQLGGLGLPVGRVTQIVGRAGSGKSALACGILGNIQRMYPDACYLALFDGEATTDRLRLKQLNVDNPQNIIITDFTIEDFFKAIQGLIDYKKENPEMIKIPCVLVLDSFASAKVEKTKSVEQSESITGLKAKITSFWFEKLISDMAKYQITVIVINQIKDNIQMGYIQKTGSLKALGTDKAIPGGKALGFYTFTLLHLKDSTLKESEWGFAGNKVEVETWKCKSFIPYVKIPYFFNFVKGFRPQWTMVPILVEEKYITTSGGYKNKYWVDSKGDPRRFIKKDIDKLYEENVDGFADALHKLFNDYKKDYIKRYRYVFEAFERNTILKIIDDGDEKSLREIVEDEKAEKIESETFKNIDSTEDKKDETITPMPDELLNL